MTSSSTRTNINGHIVKTHQLTVQRGKKTLLNGISVSLPPGLTYILGKNGSGKTTFLNCLAHLIPYTGEVWLGGQSLSTLSPRQRAQRIAVIHQRLQPPLHLSLRDFVRMGRFPHQSWWKEYSSEDEGKVDQALTRMGVIDLAHRRLDEISGGEWQKGLIARALAQEADLWLFDEPASYLDPLAKKQLYSMLSEFADQGQHIICVTHDLEAMRIGQAGALAFRAGSVVLQEVHFRPDEAMIAEIFA